MFQKIRFTIFNIFLLCVAFGILFFVKVDSFAQTSFTIECTQTVGNNTFYREWKFPSTDNDRRFAFYDLSYQHRYILCSNLGTGVTYDFWYATIGQEATSGSTAMSFSTWKNMFGEEYYFYGGNPNNNTMDFNYFNQAVYDFGGIPVFDNLDTLNTYLTTGQMPGLPFDDTLELDDFKVSSGQYGVGALNYRTMFTVFWSNPDIYTVKVDVKSTLKADSFVTNGSSPFMRFFNARDYAVKNGDIVYLIATPYKQDGSYGISLMYSFVFNGNSPIADVWRPLVNNNFTDNTITIPYTGVSGNDDITLPVSGVTTTNLYKVYYNPTTEEITNQYFYDVYYSPVVILPDVSDNEQSNEIQETIINNYTTNNYYNVSNDINNTIDIDLTDVSSGDIQQTYDDFGNFFKGFGSFVSKLALLFNGLFPFLSPLVAVTLVTMVGIIVLGAIVILVLKLLHIL